MLLAINGGNTNVAFALFEDGAVVDRQVLSTEAVVAGDQALHRVPWRSAGDVVVASVHDRAWESLRDYGETMGAPAPRRLPGDVDYPLRLAVDAPDAVGADRVCNAAAALHQAGAPAAAVDFGTAVTVDVAADDAFLGGVILPGRSLQARALHDFTARLPAVDPERPDGPLGRDTASAISAGVHFGLAGAVREILARMEAALETGLSVFVTGGDGPRFAGDLGRTVVLSPDLTFHGILLAWRKDAGGEAP